MKQHINIAIDTKYNVHGILKKYSAMRVSLFNYWSLLFYNKYLYYFFNCFLQRGKKQLAIKLVYFLLYILKKKTMISPILVLQSALLNYRHILQLRIIKYKRRKIFSYLLLSLNKQVKVSIKYLAKQFASFNVNSNKYTLIERLSIFILNLFFKTPLIFGRFLQHSAHVHKLIQENQKGYKKTKVKKFKRRRRRRFKAKFQFKRWRAKNIIKKNKNIKNKLHKKIKNKLNFKSKLKNVKKQKKNKYVNKGVRKRIPNFLIKMYKKKRRIYKKRLKEFSNLQRRVRKVLIKSFTRPLQRRSYRLKKRKVTDYNFSIKQLYTDAHNSIDFNLLNEIQTSNTFFVNSISRAQIRNFFYYIILGKWYKILEKTYYQMTMSFWHLYNLRTRFLKHYLTSSVSHQELIPQVQNSYTKFLIKYLYTTQYSRSVNTTKMTSNFSVDPMLLSHYINLYSNKIKSKVVIPTQSVVLTYKTSSNVKKSDIFSNIKLNSIRCLLQSKRVRTYIRNTISKFRSRNLYKRLLLVVRSFYIQNHLKIRKRTYSSVINILLIMRRYFFMLIRFKLIRLVWFGLRAFALRRTKPLFESTKRNIATRVFLVKN
jgi:ribosomal protein S7